MARTYVVQPGDTLGKIAKKFYGDAGAYRKLADYNGIRNPDWLSVGQTLEVPSRAELEGKPVAPPEAPALPPPNGLPEILDTFGNVYEYLRADGTLDPRWERDQLASARLPYPLRLSWEPSRLVTAIYGHRKLAEVFPEVFQEIERQGLKDQVRTYGGCFNYRTKRTSGKLSTHTWGIALDLNPDTNAQGKAGDMDPGVVEIFRSFGFKWGGDWAGRAKDPMHFQFCSGY